MKVVSISLFCLVVLVQVSQAFSRDPASPVEDFKLSTAVFVGKVVKGEIVKEPEDDGSKPILDVVAFTFVVSQNLKGAKQEIITVTSIVDEGAGGFPFKIGGEYLVYARGRPEKLTTNLGTRTAVFTRSIRDFELKELVALTKKE